MAHEIRFLRRRDGRREALRCDAAEGETLLDAARGAGLPIARGCAGDGLCTGCALEILEGAEGLSPEGDQERRMKQRSRVPGDWRLACQAEVHGPLTATARYW